jgi:hypothetical protein
MGMLHGANAEFSAVARWTSTFTGRVHIDASFTGQYSKHDGTVATVGVKQNGASLFDGLLSGFIGSAPDYLDAFGTQPEQVYDGTVAVSAGDTIDFVTVHTGIWAYDGYLGLKAVITAQLVETPTENIGRIKSHPNGDPVKTVDVAVTAGLASDEVFYVEGSDRSSGIRVHWPGHTLPAVGSWVTVEGTILTAGTGERYIEATAVPPGTGSGGVAPLGMNSKTLGGGGLNNIGLLVRTCGRVSLGSGSRFTLSDGGVDVTVELPSGIALPGDASYIGVTGVSSCEKDASSNLLRLLRATAGTDPY